MKCKASHVPNVGKSNLLATSTKASTQTDFEPSAANANPSKPQLIQKKGGSACD